MKKLILILVLIIVNISVFAQIPVGSTKVNNLKIFGEIIPVPETINIAPDFVVTQDSTAKKTTYTQVSEVENLSWQDVADSLSQNTKFDSISIAEKVVLDSVDIPYREGGFFYGKDTKAPSFYNDLPDFTHQLGYEHVARYYNNTGLTITDGTLLTPVGQKINGEIVPTVRLAGNGSIDSLKFVAASTTTTLNGAYGVVTLLGPVNGLDLSAFNDNDFSYVGHNGLFTNVSPTPPEYSLLIGKVFYADNDSGQMYIWPGQIEFNPSPIISGDTSRYNTILTINTQNVFEYIPISVFTIEDAFGYEKIGDSILVNVDGFVTIALNNSYTGNAQSDIWRQAIFVNNIEVYSNSRSTTSTSVGNQTTIKTLRLFKDDWISFKMTNESANRDPTLNDISYEIIYLHE